MAGATKTAEISLDDLRRWATMYFDFLESKKQTKFWLNHDYYWSHQPTEELFDPYNRVELAGLDQLYDNLHDIRLFESDPDARCLPLLEDFASLLLYISTGFASKEPR